MELHSGLDVSPPLILLFATPLLLAYLYYRFCYLPFQVLKRNGFIGPAPSFFFGNYKERKKLGGIIEHVTSLYKEYGPIVGYYIGKRPFILVCDLELIKLISVKDFNDHFLDRPSLPETLEKKYRPIGLLFSGGETWRAARRILSPTFSSFKMKAMAPIIKSTSDTLVEVFGQLADSDKSFDIVKVFGHFSLETIIATGFGRRIEIQRGQGDELAEAAAIAFSSTRENTSQSLFLLMVFLSNFPWLECFLPYLLRNSERSKAFRVLHETAIALTQQRRRERDSEKYKDMLQLIMDTGVEDSDLVGEASKASESKLKLTDEEIVDHCVVLLLAGYETTSNTLGYAAYLLALHTEAQEKLQAEIDAYFEDKPEASLYQASQELKYLDMVVRETLRLHPTAPMFGRKCTKEYKYKGMTFSKGVMAQFCSTILHKDPQYWRDPEKFDPMRFTAEEKAKRPQMCYLPFGSGPRSCIGMRLALLETKIALIQVLRRFTFVRTPDTEVPLKVQFSITVAPVNGIYLKVVSRKRN